MRTGVGGAAFTFTIALFDSADARVTTAVNGDFTKYVDVDGADDALAVTVTHIANGRYKVTGTFPAVAAGSVKFVHIEVSHATHAVRGFAEDFEVYNAIQTDVNVVQISGDVTAADNLEAFYEGAILTGSVTNASPTTTTFIDTTKSATDSIYNKMVVVPRSGVHAGIPRKVSSYNGATKEFTVDEAWTSALAQNDTFALIGTIR